jgi:hypothetical protein
MAIFLFLSSSEIEAYIFTKCRSKTVYQARMGEFAVGFVGSKTGPRKSKIVGKLGPAYFGISKAALEGEIELYRDEEFRGIVDPVHEDDRKRYYLVFSAPNGGAQRFYPEEHGYHLEGDLLIEKERKSD